MSVLETLRAISKWKIDAVKDNNPDAVHIAAHELDTFFDDPPSFVIGKKGTGKTAYATKLKAKLPEGVFYVTFGELLPTFLEIQRHQRTSDFATKQVAIQVAACLSALKQWAQSTGRPLTQRKWERIFARVQRPAFLPAALATAAALLLRTKTNPDGTEEAEVRLNLGRIRFHLNNARMLRDYLARILRSVQSKDANVCLFIDGIDELENFTALPFSNDDYELLRAFIYAVYTWDQGEERPIRLIAVLRPEFLDIAQIPNIRPRIEDIAKILEWEQERLFLMLSHRIDVEVEASFARAQERGAYARRIGTRELFGRSETDHRAIVERLFQYSFLRPRDLIRYTKFAADYALQSGDPHQPLPLEYFDKVLDKQRDYLLNEMMAELAITLPDYQAFVHALTQLHAVNEEKLFIKRDTFEEEIEAAILATRSELDARTVITRLYSAFAIGYRGAGQSRHFRYGGGHANLPEGNQITLHNLFREVPSDLLLKHLAPGAPIAIAAIGAE